MNWKSLFNLRAANPWIIAMGVVANMVWSFFVMIIAFYILDVGGGIMERVQVGLLLALFMGPFLLGLFCGWLAFDDRGAMYGVLGACGSILIILLYLWASGGIAIMLSIAALTGGFNGGALTRYRTKHK